MNKEKAKRIIQDYQDQIIYDQDEINAYLHALSYLIETEQNVECMMLLGNFYERKLHFNKALHYYEMASLYHHEESYERIGFIYYYGRCGLVDYHKAYKYFKQAMELGSLIASVKVAEMYHYGYVVMQNEEIYEGMILALYPKVVNASYLSDPLPEVYLRLARIYKKYGMIHDCLSLYDLAIQFLAQRIQYDPFFENLIIMKELILDYYALVDFNEESFHLFDLYLLLQMPCIIHFDYYDEEYEIEASVKDNQFKIEFCDQIFTSIDSFFLEAMINNQLLVTYNTYLSNFKLL